MMKLYVTNNLFAKEAYVEHLKAFGVEAYATDNGVMLDIDAYKANYSWSKVSHFVYMNHRWIKQLY